LESLLEYNLSHTAEDKNLLLVEVLFITHELPKLQDLMVSKRQDSSFLGRQS